MTEDGSPAHRVEVRAGRYGDPDVARIVEEVQAEYVRRYGGPDASPLTPEDFDAPEGTFVIAYLDGEPVGSGAFRRHDDEAAEIKRMYVRPDLRGTGVAQVLLAELEALAADAGYRRIVLETGTQSPEAMRLYEKSGYDRIEPFGYYRDYPQTRCYGRQLPSRPA